MPGLSRVVALYRCVSTAGEERKAAEYTYTGISMLFVVNSPPCMLQTDACTVGGEQLSSVVPLKTPCIGTPPLPSYFLRWHLMRVPAMLSQSEERLVEIQNGCICCSLREDLLLQILSLAAEGRFDYILIESSGISDPMQVSNC